MNLEEAIKKRNELKKEIISKCHDWSEFDEERILRAMESKDVNLEKLSEFADNPEENDFEEVFDQSDNKMKLKNALKEAKSQQEKVIDVQDWSIDGYHPSPAHTEAAHRLYKLE